MPASRALRQPRGGAQYADHAGQRPERVITSGDDSPRLCRTLFRRACFAVFSLTHETPGRRRCLGAARAGRNDPGSDRRRWTGQANTQSIAGVVDLSTLQRPSPRARFLGRPGDNRQGSDKHGCNAAVCGVRVTLLPGSSWSRRVPASRLGPVEPRPHRHLAGRPAFGETGWRFSGPGGRPSDQPLLRRNERWFLAGPCAP